MSVFETTKPLKRRSRKVFCNNSIFLSAPFRPNSRSFSLSRQKRLIILGFFNQEAAYASSDRTLKTRAKLQSRYGELAPDLEFEKALAQNGSDFCLRAKAGGAGLGSLNIKKTGNGFSIGWESREIDQAQMLAREISKSRANPLSIIDNNPDVESFIQLSEGERYLVKFQGSEKWISFEPETMEATASEWRPSLNTSRGISQEFANGIKIGNRMLANKLYAQALREFNQLIEIFGPEPELVLGRGLARIGERSLKVARAIEETISGGRTSSGADFLGEINARLARNGIVPAGDRISIVSDGRKLCLNYDLSKFPSSSPVSPDSIASSEFILFVEDSPGLNNLNWDVSIIRTIEEAVSLDIGEFKLLTAVDLADLRPSRLLAPAKTEEAGQGAKARFCPHYFPPVNASAVIKTMTMKKRIDARASLSA